MVWRYEDPSRSSNETLINNTHTKRNKIFDALIQTKQIFIYIWLIEPFKIYKQFSIGGVKSRLESELEEYAVRKKEAGFVVFIF